MHYNKFFSYDIFALFSILLILNGCGPTHVNLKIKKAAEINLSSGLKVAVIDFNASQSMDKNLGAKLSDDLSFKLIQNKYFKIIERNQISNILHENNIILKSTEDIDNISEIGSLINSDILIYGNINTYKSNDVTVNDTIYSIYHVERVACVEIIFKIMDVKSRSIIASRTFKSSKRSTAHQSYEKETQEEKIIGMAVEAITQKNTKSPLDKAMVDALTSLPESNSLFNSALNDILLSFIAQIAPNFTVESRIIESGRNKKMHSALDFAKKNKWDAAKKLWEEILQDLNSKQDYASAHYNLGLYYESIGDMDKAEEEFTNALNINDKTEYLIAVTNVRDKKDELKKTVE